MFSCCIKHKTISTYHWLALPGCWVIMITLTAFHWNCLAFGCTWIINLILFAYFYAFGNICIIFKTLITYNCLAFVIGLIKKCSIWAYFLIFLTIFYACIKMCSIRAGLTYSLPDAINSMTACTVFISVVNIRGNSWTRG